MGTPRTPADAAGSTRGENQNVARAARVLDALADAGSAGLRLIDVVGATGLTKTVAHRFLGGLVAHGMATVDRTTGRYFLGDRIFAWAVRMGEHFELADRVAPLLRTLAGELEDTIYFHQRRGDDMICLGRAEGAFPVKTLTLMVGDRRPLGVGSGSLAIAAHLADAELEAIVARRAPAYAEYSLTPQLLRADVALTREQGFALNVDRVIPGMTGVGMPIRSSDGRPVAAISVVAISPRLAGERRIDVVRRLGDAVAEVQTDLRGLLDETLGAPFWRAG